MQTPLFVRPLTEEERTTIEADRILSADELEARVCAYYGCPREPHLVMLQKVA